MRHIAHALFPVARVHIGPCDIIGRLRTMSPTSWPTAIGLSEWNAAIGNMRSVLRPACSRLGAARRELRDSVSLQQGRQRDAHDNGCLVDAYIRLGVAS